MDVDIGHDYAGLEVGRYIIYDVDSLTYDDFTATVDTASYLIKEVVDSKYTDLEGDEAYKIIRYRKDNDTPAWVLIDVWNSKLTNTNFQKVEENVRFVKLIFPVKEGATWNGNSMNNQDQMDYSYDYIDNPENIGGNNLNEVLKVTQLEVEDTFINPKLFVEKYAKNVGMVYKKSYDLYRGNFTSPWSGYDVTMTLSSYGN